MRNFVLLLDENSEAEKTRYEVTVVTGDCRYAGTDANVYMEMVGKHGKTGEIKLDDNKNNFEKGQSDVFKVEIISNNEFYKINLLLNLCWFSYSQDVRNGAQMYMQFFISD